MSINELSQSHIAQESIDLYHELKENHIDGPWSPSPVEEKDFLLREFFINKIGILDKFRRTFLVAGRQNFPDSPRGGLYRVGRSWSSAIAVETAWKIFNL